MRNRPTLRDQTRVPCIGRQILEHWTTRDAPQTLPQWKILLISFGLSRQPHQNTTWQPSNPWQSHTCDCKASPKFSFTLTLLRHLPMSAMPSPSKLTRSPVLHRRIPWSLIFLSSIAASSYYCNLHLHSPYECHKIHSQTLLHVRKQTQEAKIFSQWLGYFRAELEFESRSLNLCPLFFFFFFCITAQLPNALILCIL